MPEAVLAGHRTFFREIGEGPRRGIALHCSLAHSKALEGLLGALGDLGRFRALDLPSHGRSADWDETRHLQDLVVDIAAAAVAEDDGPLDFIGHSFGGSALLRTASIFPDRVRSLTLIEPPYYDAIERAAPQALALQLALDAPVAEAMAAGDRAAAARHFSDVWGGPGGWAALSEDVRRYVLDRIHTIEGVGRVLNRDFAGLVPEGGLEGIACPVLLIRGDRSPPAIEAIQTTLARRIPDATEAVVEGAGHMVPLTHAEAVARHIRAFFSRT